MATKLRERLLHLPVILTGGYSDALARRGADGFPIFQNHYWAENLALALRCALSSGTRVQLDS